jgi:hypothetical protein
MRGALRLGLCLAVLGAGLIATDAQADETGERVWFRLSNEGTGVGKAGDSESFDFTYLRGKVHGFKVHMQGELEAVSSLGKKTSRVDTHYAVDMVSGASGKWQQVSYISVPKSQLHLLKDEFSGFDGKYRNAHRRGVKLEQLDGALELDMEVDFDVPNESDTDRSRRPTLKKRNYLRLRIPLAHLDALASGGKGAPTVEEALTTMSLEQARTYVDDAGKAMLADLAAKNIKLANSRVRVLPRALPHGSIAGRIAAFRRSTTDKKLLTRRSVARTLANAGDKRRHRNRTEATRPRIKRRKDKNRRKLRTRRKKLKH